MTQNACALVTRDTARGIRHTHTHTGAFFTAWDKLRTKKWINKCMKRPQHTAPIDIIEGGLNRQEYVVYLRIYSFSHLFHCISYQLSINTTTDIFEPKSYGKCFYNFLFVLSSFPDRLPGSCQNLSWLLLESKYWRHSNKQTTGQRPGMTYNPAIKTL